MRDLRVGEKEEWSSPAEPCWMRTGCENIWDAILWAYKDYRESTPPQRLVIQRQRLGEEVVFERPTGDVLHEVIQIMQSDDNDSDDKKIFHTFIPPRVQKTRLATLVERTMNETDDNHSMEDALITNSILLAGERINKKFNSGEFSVDDIRPYLENYVKNTLQNLEMDQKNVSFDILRKVCKDVGFDLLLIAPNERVLFDSHGSLDNSKNNKQETIIVLAHPDGSYDSLGRFSFTRDGSKKITRLFPPDDDVIISLRQATL